MHVLGCALLNCVHAPTEAIAQPFFRVALLNLFNSHSKCAHSQKSTVSVMLLGNVCQHVLVQWGQASGQQLPLCNGRVRFPL